jgi:hypothetical protein
MMPIIFMPVLVIVGISNILQGNGGIIIKFFIITMLLQFVVGFISILLARERLSYLFAVPMTRLVYGPLRTYLLYRSALAAMRGASVGWNKLSRTGSLAAIPDQRRKLFQPIHH